MNMNLAPCKLTWCEHCGSPCGSAVSNHCTCKPLVNSQLRHPLPTLDTPGLVGLQRLGLVCTDVQDAGPRTNPRP